MAQPPGWSAWPESASGPRGRCCGRSSVSLDHKADLLVADDNRVNRLLVGRTLEQLGHRVGFAENGRQALEVLRQQPADLVLLDIEMPEMNGYQTLDAL